MLKFIFKFLLLFYLTKCDDFDCTSDPVKLDEDFIICCKGKPTFTSEKCIDELISNNTFSSECLVDCMYKDFKFYDGIKLDLEAVHQFFDTNVTDAEIRTMYVIAFEICSQFDLESLQKQMFPLVEIPNEHNCDLFAAYMDMCLWYETITHCPQKYMYKSDKCFSKIAWVNNCLIK